MHGNTKDISNQRFGRLVVVRLGRQEQGRPRFWECLCDCGNRTEVVSTVLRQGRTKSCGCLSKEIKIRANDVRRLPDGLAAARSIFRSYRTNAKRRSLDFCITEEDFLKITKEDCFYCGISPSQSYCTPWGSYYQYNGIDRVDNRQGYVVENIVACCKLCNWGKTNLSQKDFLEWIERLTQRWLNLVKKKSLLRVPLTG